MKKAILITVLICLILLFDTAIAISAGVVCNTSDPTKMLLKSYNFISLGQGNSFIKLINKTEGNITIRSVESKSDVLLIEESPKGVIGSEEEFQVVVRLYPEVEHLQGEQILITYIGSSENEESVIIRCSGSLGSFSESYITTPWVAALLGLFSYPLFFLGIAFMIYGHLKRKRKLKILGLYLVPLAILLYMLFLFLA